MRRPRMRPLHVRDARLVEGVGGGREGVEDVPAEQLVPLATGGRQVGVVDRDVAQLAVEDHVGRQELAEQLLEVDRHVALRRAGGISGH